MQPPASYDLITLEPPPIVYAGVAALYSREFYRLARTRLNTKGYISHGCRPIKCRRRRRWP